MRMEHSTPGPGRNPHAGALQACVSEALSEAPGLASRWVARLGDLLKQQGAWAANPREKAGLVNAVQILTANKHRFETEWAEHWSRAIKEALQRRGDGPQARRSLANVSFDELELMDETQIQATVQVAKLENDLHGTAGDALLELSALLSSAQGYSALKVDSNPLRPEVAIAALREAMETITTDKDARTLWLQNGTPILSEELQVLYRLLIRLLQGQGVTRAGFSVVQAPNNLGLGKGSATSVRQRPAGIAEGQEAEAVLQQQSLPDVLSLSRVQDLLVAAPPDVSYSELLPAVTPVSSRPSPIPHSADPWNVLSTNGLTTIASHESIKAKTPTVEGAQVPIELPQLSGSDAHSEVGVYISSPEYVGPERRSHRAVSEVKRHEASQYVKALAGEVVRLVLDGMMHDSHVLPPVREMLQRLEPALLRIAHEDPMLYAEKCSPARRLLDEITERSLAFAHVDSMGLSRFLATLDDVAQLFLLVDVDVSTLVDTALEVLAPDDSSAQTESVDQAPGVSEVTPVNTEQRFLMADKVAQEIARHPDFAQAAPEVQAFAMGQWSRVIAQARMRPAARVQPPGRLSADLRYLGVLSDLLWSSCVEASSRNRGRLARLIPGLLRTLREGLQTIDCDAAVSRRFFTAIMSLHEAGLRVDAERKQGDVSNVLTLPPEPSPAAATSNDGPGMRSNGIADAGFMTAPFPDLHEQDFVDTQPMRYDGDAAPLAPTNVPDLSAGARLSLVGDDGQSQRLQLTWSSPHGTMYLFNGPGSRATSMTRRSFERLWQSHRISFVAAHSVLDDAPNRGPNVPVLNRSPEPTAPVQDTEYPDLLPPFG